ncbi:MAG: hypothetical protein J5842_05915 [Lachnospiraceae bacterium]|nr:hypothetical protein [Lachnospiraceae bacterium]
MKNKHDYDSTFKSLKARHKRLFISVINEAFGKHYPLNSEVEILPTEGFFVDKQEFSKDSELQRRESDSLIRIENDYYLVECQTYDDDSMAIRLAEYTFLAARSNAVSTQQRVTLNLPSYTVIYIKRTEKTPLATNITYNFPNGQSVDYSTKNVFIDDLTKEEIIDKKLYVYIPFYVARSEKELSTEKNYQKAIEDLEYFREQMIKSRITKELTQEEINDICSSTNIIVTHITDGNSIESEVTDIMGGEIYELSSDRIKRETREEVMGEYEPILAEKDRSIAQKDAEMKKKDELISRMKDEIVRLGGNAAVF